jgi:multiple sugar transport system substrate-binding protein
MSELDLSKLVTRRSLLKIGAGTAGAIAAGSALAACGSGGEAAAPVASGTSAAPAVTGPVSFGARTVDEIPTKQLTAALKAFTAETGIEYKYNATESNAFQNNLSQYLQGTPDDLFQWMAGFRMQFFADQDLLVDISDVWSEAGGVYTEGYKGASTGSDGGQYFIPFTWYPWAVHYRKSVWADAGVDADSITTWDDWMGALEAFKKKGLTPIALGDKGGWEAMGTFDIINLRTNGYEYHVNLMAGREKWTDSRTIQAFKNWEATFAYQNKNALDLEWDGAARLVLQKKAAMQVMGSFCAEVYLASSQADYDDLALFPFPEIESANGRDAVEAPIDGFCVAAKGKDVAAGKELAKFLMSKSAIDAFLTEGPALMASTEQDTSAFDPFQKQQVALAQGSKYITQFLDRDSRPDFAGPIVGPALQSFIKNPKDVNKIVDGLQKQWDSLPPL